MAWSCERILDIITFIFISIRLLLCPSRTSKQRLTSLELEQRKDKVHTIACPVLEEEEGGDYLDQITTLSGLRDAAGILNLNKAKSNYKADDLDELRTAIRVAMARLCLTNLLI